MSWGSAPLRSAPTRTVSPLHRFKADEAYRVGTPGEPLRAARRLAHQAGVPVLSGSDDPVIERDAAHARADKLGYPVIVKASMGSGGRGMRVAQQPDQLDEALEQARREAGAAFGVADVFLVGRDHQWKAFTVALAGGGVKGGQLYGATSADGTEVTERPVTIADLFRTFSLDIDADKENDTPLGRPVKLVDGGTQVRELF
jgi:hypothetical protein